MIDSPLVWVMLAAIGGASTLLACNNGSPLIDFADRLYERGTPARSFDRLPYPEEPAAIPW